MRAYSAFTRRKNGQQYWGNFKKKNPFIYKEDNHAKCIYGLLFSLPFLSLYISFHLLLSISLYISLSLLPPLPFFPVSLNPYHQLSNHYFPPVPILSFKLYSILLFCRRISHLSLHINLPIITWHLLHFEAADDNETCFLFGRPSHVHKIKPCYCSSLRWQRGHTTKINLSELVGKYMTCTTWFKRLLENTFSQLSELLAEMTPSLTTLLILPSFLGLNNIDLCRLLQFRMKESKQSNSFSLMTFFLRSRLLWISIKGINVFLHQQSYGILSTFCLSIALWAYSLIER